MPDLLGQPYYQCEPLQDYDRLRERYFDEPLARLGFVRLPESDQEWYITWQNYCRQQVYTRPGPNTPPLYIILTADNHYQDVPNHIKVELGEGSHEYPDVGFNSIELAALVIFRDPTRRTAAADQYGLYGLPSIAQFEAIMQQAAHDLFTHGHNFLNGDLAEFYELRRHKNRAFPPFTYQWREGVDELVQRALAEDARIKEALRQKYLA